MRTPRPHLWFVPIAFLPPVQRTISPLRQFLTAAKLMATWDSRREEP
jgi:hypothetical protein